MWRENSPFFVPDGLDGRQLVPYVAFCRAFRFAGCTRRKDSDDGSSNSFSMPLTTAFPRLAACRGCAGAMSLGMLREGAGADICDVGIADRERFFLLVRSTLAAEDAGLSAIPP